MWTQSHPSPEPCGCPNFTNRLPKQPIRGARLNAKYCLVKLTYLQAQQLFQAASQMEDDARMNPKDIGWTGAEAKALKEALDKLRETSERWPQGMDV